MEKYNFCKISHKQFTLLLLISIILPIIEFQNGIKELATKTTKKPDTVKKIRADFEPKTLCNCMSLLSIA
jgi:hypothetical protein